MRKRNGAPLALATALALLTVDPAAGQQGPDHVYLTWRGSTSTTMTVNVHTPGDVPAVEVRYDVVSRDGDPGSYAMRATGKAHRIDGLADGRWIHWIDLTGLEPDGRYWFVVGSEEHGFSRERSFRTVPDDDTPIRFIAGGDLGLGSDVQALHAHAAAHEPRFAIIGGDLAYVNGELSEVEDWDEWFDQWEEGMVTPDGLTVPMVLAVGNHEVRGGYLGGPERAPFYTGFFAQPTSTDRPSYFRTRFGALMALYTLDTGHIVSHDSQVGWLEEALAGDAGVPYRFAQYHIPMYPSHRDYDGSSMRLAREHWLPLFDRHGLTAAFENHDHTFKRTHPLRADSVVEEGGTIYFGDGAWGRGDRPVRLSDRWYLAAQGANRHFWVVDVAPDGVEYRAVDTRGGVFHVYPSDLPDATAAQAYFRTLPQRWELRDGALDVRGDAGGLEVTLTNREDYPFIATLGAVDQDGRPVGRVRGEETVELEPGQAVTRTVELDGDGPAAEGPVQIRADLDVDAPRGRVYTRVARTVGFDEPAEAPGGAGDGGGIRLDGVTDEWTSWPWRVSAPAPREDGPPAGWSGQADASARVDFRVEGGDLLVAVRVMDDHLVPHAGDDWEDGDGLLLWLDEAPDGEFDDDPYLGIPAPSGAGGVPVMVTDADWQVLATATRAWAAATDDGWSAELRIPLDRVGDPDRLPSDPSAVRLNLGIVDVDEPGGQADVVLRRPEWELDWDYDAAGLIRIRGAGASDREPSPWVQTGWALRRDTTAAPTAGVGLETPAGSPGGPGLPVDADRPFRLRFELEGPGPARVPAGADDPDAGPRFRLQGRRNGGPWHDLLARDFPYPDEISTPRVSIVHGADWEHGDPAGDVLDGSGAPFAGGSVVALDSLTAEGSVAAHVAGPVQTEWEWPLVIRRYADGAVANEAGDAFDFRMVDRAGRPVGVEAEGIPVSVELRIPDGHLGGTYVETPGVLGPWQAADGSLYFPMEPAETFNVLMTVKSTDFGASWQEVDGENRPATDDLEGFATALHDGRIYMLHQVSEATYLHAFATTDVETAGEGWVIRDELVAEQPEPPTQVAALVAHEDGRLTAVYGDSLGLRLRVRTPGGGWGPEARIDGPAGTVASGVMAVGDAGGRTHLAYTAGDAGGRDVWYRPVSAQGQPGRAVRVARGVGTAEEDVGAVAPLVHLPGPGLTVIPYRLNDGHLYTRTVRSDGTLTPATRVTGREVVQNGADSEQVGADAVAFHGQVTVVFIDEESRDLWVVAGRPGSDGGVEWGPARPLVEDIDAQWVRGRVIRDATGRPVYGVVFDAGSDGGSGMNRFVALPLE